MASPRIVKGEVVIFWFRRDLRLEDNVGLIKAFEDGARVLPVFIFDADIVSELAVDDARITFIHHCLEKIHMALKSKGSGLLCQQGKPLDVWQRMLQEFNVKAIYTNEDYEPYAIERDTQVKALAETNGTEFHSFKDQVIYAKSEVVKPDASPYTVFTPYMKRWRARHAEEGFQVQRVQNWENLVPHDFEFPSLQDLGFEESSITVAPYTLNDLEGYDERRNIPGIEGTSLLSPHLRFGTIGIRQLMLEVWAFPKFVNELVWREFFMQILYHFPQVVTQNFRSKYDGIPWRNNEDEFEKWKSGQTGYPMVDAGMRQLNATGYIHNRVRMVVASFLCKHLLIDWRWGEAYFAEKLLDYELSSNNGNWQWAAGTGCDAAPYFRVFNPSEQAKKFDPERIYIRRWVPEIDELDYPQPMVEHKVARERAISTYKQGLAQTF